MSFAPYAVIWVALVAVAIVGLLAGRRPRMVAAVIFLVLTAALALWLVFRPAAIPPTFHFAGRQWSIGPVAYQLTGVALLLGLTAAFHAFLNSDIESKSGANMALIAGLTAAALPSVWAVDERTRVLGLAFFGVGAALAARFALLSDAEGRAAAMHPALRVAAALFPVWLSGALPAAGASLMLLAAVVALGVWPFGGRSKGGHSDPALALLFNGLPIVIGAALLGSAVGATLPAGAVAAATALGLLSLVIGLGRAWNRAPGGMSAALRLGLVGLALTTAVWAGEATTLAARLAVFAPALLLLGADGAAVVEGAHRFRPTPRLVTAALVYLAVAGLPLTVGFAALAPLYEAWQTGGGWLLILVTIALIALWLASIYKWGQAGLPDATESRVWLRRAALWPAAVGLVSLNPAFLSVGAPTWVAIALPPVIGFLVGRFAPGSETIDGLLRESFAVPQVAGRLETHARQLGRAAVDAVADALAILEGEYGLLWLLGLALLLLWLA